MNRSMLSQIEDTFSKQLRLMAADPEIQNELKKIEQEFTYAETDGLENKKPKS